MSRQSLLGPRDADPGAGAVGCCSPYRGKVGESAILLRPGKHTHTHTPGKGSTKARAAVLRDEQRMGRAKGPERVGPRRADPARSVGSGSFPRRRRLGAWCPVLLGTRWHFWRPGPGGSHTLFGRSGPGVGTLPSRKCPREKRGADSFAWFCSSGRERGRGETPAVTICICLGFKLPPRPEDVMPAVRFPRRAGTAAPKWVKGAGGPPLVTPPGARGSGQRTPAGQSQYLLQPRWGLRALWDPD